MKAGPRFPYSFKEWGGGGSRVIVKAFDFDQISVIDFEVFGYV